MISTYDVVFFNPHCEGFGSNSNAGRATTSTLFYLKAKPMETAPEFGVIRRARKSSAFLQ